MQRRRKPGDNAAIWVTRLKGKDLPDSPPRVKQEAERAQALAKDTAPDCEHNWPHGSWRNANDLSPCPECNGKKVRAS